MYVRTVKVPSERKKLLRRPLTAPSTSSAATVGYWGIAGDVASYSHL